MDPQTLLASTAPLAGTTAVLVTAIRQGLPAIDGMRRVLALVGAVAVLLVWLYLTSLALLFGAEVNAMLEGVGAHE